MSSSTLRRIARHGLGLLAGLGLSMSAPAAQIDSEQSTEQSTEPARIAWFGTWDGGAAEAMRTGRPILLMSAAPQCNRVPGLW